MKDKKICEDCKKIAVAKCEDCGQLYCERCAELSEFCCDCDPIQNIKYL